MKKVLSKALSVLILTSIVLPSASTVFAETAINNQVFVVNNAAGTSDTVKVTDLEVGDIVKVYSAAVGGTLIGKAVAKADKVAKGALATISAVVSIPQLGVGAGNVYVTVTSKGFLEGDVSAAVPYAAEAKTIPGSGIAFKLVNNSVGTPDTVTMTGLAVGDIVKLYSTAVGGTPIGTATAKADKVAKGEDQTISATVSIPQLGTGVGSVYPSVTSKGFLESSRLGPVAYGAESLSVEPIAGTIKIVNNAVGTADTITVPCVAVGDIVQIYSVAIGGTVIGTAVAKADKVAKGEDPTISAIVSVPQLGTGAGTVYASAISKGLLESYRTAAIAYLAEGQSVTPDVSSITSINNALGTADTVKVTGLVVGDIVKVYSAAVGGTVIGKAVAKADKVAKGEDPTISAIVSIPQLGAVVGNVYVSVTSKGLLESNKTVAVPYLAEKQSTMPVASTITIVNNALGTADKVTVPCVEVGDKVKIYSEVTVLGVTSIGPMIGTAIAKADKVAKGEIATISAVISIPQLGASLGNIYVSVTSKGLLESNKTAAVPFVAEKKSPKVRVVP